MPISKTLLSITVASLLASPLLADDTLGDLESLLNEVSDIATKNSLNVDYLPSVVTVINAERFRAAGIVNLAQALDMLPGFQIQHSTIGYTMTTVRGFKNPNAYLSDKIKILIDGVAVHYETAGSSHFFLDFPLELVKKIEVLRGPASSIYGAGSLYGTINIITKSGSGKKQNALRFETGSYKHVGGSANVSTKIGDWDFFADGYYRQNDKVFLSKPLGKMPNDVDEAMQDYSVGFRLVNGDVQFSTRLKSNDAGNSYSFEGKFDPIPEKDQGHGSTFLFSQLQYNTQIEDIKLDNHVSFSHRQAWLDANILSKSHVAKRFAKIDMDTGEGLFIEEELHEDNIELESVATFPTFYGNNLLAGIGFQYTKVQDDSYYNSIEDYISKNKDAITSHPNYADFDYNEYDEPGYWNNPTTSKLDGSVSRNNTFVYLQDLITLTDSIDLTLGLRADCYSDFGIQLSKRAALVYRANEKIIFKLLYGSAFRAPSFTEAYANGHIYYRQGDEDIKPEETNTYEAVAIVKPQPNQRLMLNYFYSVLDNVIDLEEDPTTPQGYRNYEARVSQGVEVEYNFKYSDRHDLYLNGTYVDTEYSIIEDDAYEGSMPDISPVMLKGLYIFRPTDRLSFGTAWRYFSETDKTLLEWVSRDTTVDAYHVFDQTVTFNLTPDSHIRFTLKNVFDAKVKEPSYYYRYHGGVDREESEVFASYEMRF